MTLEEFRTLLDQALAFYNSEHSGAQIDEGVTGGLGAVRYDVAQVLAEAQKEQARKNIGIDELPSGPTEPAIPGQFVAIFNVTTSEEIEAAYQAGQTIAILYDNKMGYLIKRSSATDHTFAVLAPYDSNIGGIPINILSCYDNRWGRNVLEAENTANKINTITATSDGTQYPSARAVIDYVDNHRKTFEAIFDVTTSEEIEAAYQEGKTITMNNNGVIYYLRERANSQLFVFTTAPFYLDIFQEINIYTATCNNSSWSLATTKAEAVSNKVTIIDANSTNKQYPSAKAVFDYVGAMTGGGGSGADLLNENDIIKQQYFPEGYPYSEIGEGIVLPETTITPNENGEAALTEALGLIEGQTYTVNWNGTDYECVCMKVELDEDDDGVADMQIGVGLGNIGLMTGGDDTGEPFVIVDILPALAAEMGISVLVQAIDGSTTVTLSITGITEVTEVIAQKFLPKGYPYFVPGGEIVFPETTVTLPSEGEYSIALKAGYTYTVNWNGTDYACEAIAIENEYVGFAVALGNGAVFGGEYTDEPFTILMLAGMAIIFSDESAATLSITRADSYLRMDERYLPRSVENTLAEANKAVAKVEEVAAEVAAETVAETVAEATANKADKADPVFDGSISLGRKTGETVGAGSIAVGKYVAAQGETSQAFGYMANATGYYSHAEGRDAVAGGEASHAEGNSTVASGEASHAEGRSAVASGFASHAEGASTEASGYASHAEGTSAVASGSSSHAEGFSTVASGFASHAQGKYNIQDTQEKYAHIVGNGQNDENRSNAHTLDWAGNAWFAGTVEGTALILKSSTAGSSKRFRITVDDSGTLSATEVTE